MTATIDTSPGSISAAQIQALLATGRKRGMTIDDVRAAVGGSLRKLSRAEASALIVRLGGGELPNPPGEPPRTKRRKAEPGVYRMITEQHCEQIARLLNQVFATPREAAAWLQKNFKVLDLRQLRTAMRAGDVIYVLKEIIERRQAGD